MDSKRLDTAARVIAIISDVFLAIGLVVILLCLLSCESDPIYWQPEVPCPWTECPNGTVCLEDGACWLTCETDEDCGDARL